MNLKYDKPKTNFYLVAQTNFGTFLKNFIFWKICWKRFYGNKYYKSKKDERWVVYQDNIEASKITSEWFLWMHHTINELPKNKKKYLWQKNI